MAVLRDLAFRAGRVILACAALAGCAHYQALPLAETAHPAASLDELRHPPAMAAGKPLDAATIAVLAVENNPDLAAARAARGIAEAELLQAGILPNPQFIGNYGFFIAGPGNANGWSAGLAEDITALVTLQARRESARYAARGVDAGVLWQEWQVVGKARLLYVDTVESARQRRLLSAMAALLAGRVRRGEQALAAGNADLASLAPDRTALADIERQIADRDRRAAARRQALDALLGLAPDVHLDLADSLALPTLDAAAAQAAIADLPHRRPDLVALQLGYAAQEARVRGAILAQFPSLVFGASYLNDTTAIESAGPDITLDLPIFNRNQGNIAIARATRQKLYEEFTGRLVAARGEAQAMLALARQLEAQRVALGPRLAATDSAAGHAVAAFRAGNFDERSYIDFTLARLTTEQQAIAIDRALLENRVALATLLGAGMPKVTLRQPADEPADMARR